MIRPLRRAAAVFLAAALVFGLIPPDVARAGGFVEAGAASEAGVSAAGPSAGAFAAPVALPSATTLAAPLSAPALFAPAALSAPAAALSTPAPAAAGALPSAPSAGAVAALAASPLSAAAAEPDAAPEDGKTAAASAPASAPAASPSSEGEWKPHGVLEHLAYGLAWIAAFKVPASYGSAKSAFDGDSCGGACSAEAAAASEAAPSRPKLLVRLGDAAGRRAKAYREKRAIDHDNFGGPKPQPLNLWGQAREGAKTGLRLVGVAALLQAATSFFTALPWPLFLSPERMQALGRVELLIKYGPKEIAAALAHAPLSFLGVAVPFSTALEEISYRFWDFGVDFALLALARPLALGLAKVLDQVPDGSGFRSKAQSVIRGLGGLISYYAFPVAAALSALKFAEAHFALWGVEPALFAINFVSAIVLTKLAYKTRGLVAPFVAHLTFNFAMLAVGALLVTFHQPLAALAFAAVATISGVYAVLRARAAEKGLSPFRGRRFGAKLFAAAAILVALLGGSMNQYTAAPLLVHGGNVAAAVAAKPDPTAPVVVPEAPTAAANAAAPNAAPATAAAAPEAPADMVARVKPSVLKIIVMETPTSGAIGSGVIVTPEGLAVTNGHVVGDHQPGDVVQVELASGQKIPAKIVAVNHDRDLAFLQLPPRVSKPGAKDTVAWPTSAFAATAPREGDEVYAMGHPLNLPFTVTRGIVSGRGMRGNMYVQYLQTDASINHGNSGGPLYNARGEVVGINTMIIGADGSIGLGFSISAPSVARALAQYKAVGNINTASLGVVVDLSNPVQPARGVRVEYVAPDSAAAKAGLRPGDVIVGLGGAVLPTSGGAESARLIATILAQVQPGQKISVAVVRFGQKSATMLTLDAKRTTAETSGAHDFAGEPKP